MAGSRPPVCVHPATATAVRDLRRDAERSPVVRLFAFAGVVVVLWVAAVAAASGPTVPPVGTSWPGVVSPSGRIHYMAFLRPHATLVKAVRTRDGDVVARRTIAGRFGVPAPTFDRLGGLSSDGRTLVLEQLDRPSLPRASSRFIVLDTRRLLVRRSFILRGDYSFDALSPHGTLLYLIEHIDQIRYRVRALDLQTGGLLRRSVTDYRDGGTTMRGWPAARATRAGWAYTLYVGGTRTFVHALDTIHARAVCIFLPWPTEGTLYGGTLTLHGTLLRARLFERQFHPVQIDTRRLRLVG